MHKVGKAFSLTMDNLTDEIRIGLMQATAKVVGAYISEHKTTIEEMPRVMNAIHNHFLGLFRETGGRQLPAVPISESVTDEFIICLEDGKPLKMLKRHLKSVYNMTVDEYKERWGLPDDYPTVSPNYARERSSIAKKLGLGATPHQRRPRLKIVTDETGEQAGVVAAS